MKRLILLIALLSGCAPKERVDLALSYPHIIDIATTPQVIRGCRGLYTEQGAWIGFTPPASNSNAEGFSGPFDIDNRNWISRNLVGVEGFVADSSCYYPGKLVLWGKADNEDVKQTLFFADKNSAIIVIEGSQSREWVLTGDIWQRSAMVAFENDEINISLPRGERCRLTLPGFDIKSIADTAYKAVSLSSSDVAYAYVSFFNKKDEVKPILSHSVDQLIDQHTARWNGYISSILRDDMPDNYDRIAVKSLVTLVSNWRSAKGDLLHDGIVPSHATNYFVGFWGWDSWKHAVAVAKFDKELAKEQVLAMFDYQDQDGMIIDCIYSDKRDNNARDSKPPLAAWAVDAIGDVEFTKMIYPRLLKYYNWWYTHRDHNKNGIPEFGSTDGTLEAAAWESGMDNAVRYDDAKMVQNGENAWSFDQESVDLAAYLVYECELLKKFAKQIGVEFDGVDISKERVADYFFDVEDGFFYDKKLSNGEFVKVQGCEAYTPLWTGVATESQAASVFEVLKDTAKFSTYIPMPTLSAAHPKFLPKGYWRGPIWLDQTYFGISGLRKYGYTKEADFYTTQVFDRLHGLQAGSPIHENYGTHTGELLKAPHFSWSSAHLLMLYSEFGK